MFTQSACTDTVVDPIGVAIVLIGIAVLFGSSFVMHFGPRLVVTMVVATIAIIGGSLLMGPLEILLFNSVIAGIIIALCVWRYFNYY